MVVAVVSVKGGGGGRRRAAGRQRRAGCSARHSSRPAEAAHRGT